MKKTPLLMFLCMFLVLGGCNYGIQDEDGGGGGGPGGSPGGGPGGGGVTPLTSFKDDVVPILEARACEVCHTKKEEGSEEGELSLDGKDKKSKVYEEIVEEISPNYGITRVDLNDPENSLILLLPLGDPNHKVGVFRGTDDPDYRTILTWIREGARDN